MKVILVGSSHPFRGGLANFNERLIREYRNRGHDAEIWTFSLQYPGFLFPGKTQYSTDPPPPDIPIRIKVNSVNPFNWIKVGRELKRSRPDLVLVKFWIPFMAPCFGTICRIARKNRHTKVISILDNIIPHEKRPGDRILANYWIRSADGFIAMSRSVINDLQSLTPTPTSTPTPTLYSPHPLYDNFGEIVGKEDAKKALGLDPAFRYLLFFGFIRDYKGLDILLEAFADERLRKYPLKLLVAGEFYTNPKPYFDRITRLKIEDHVIMKNDFIPDHSVAHYFCAADVVVQPYKTATQSGITQIAYHFNRPIITSNAGGLAETVPDGKVGFVVEPDPAAIAGAIYRFFHEDREAGFSEQAGKEKVKYSWSTMLEAIEQVMNQINLKRPEH